MKTRHVLLAVACSALAYPLSAGPFDLFYRLSGRPPALYTAIRIVYTPLLWILEQSDISRELFVIYMRLWGGP